MQQILNFFIRNQNFLLFLFLFVLSLFLTIQSHSYHRSKFVHSANFLSGGIYKSANSVSSYFDLKEENESLLEENNRLKSILYNRYDQIDTSAIDFGAYRLIPAKVYKSTYSNTNNYLTIGVGNKKGIQEDYGVITSNGIVGIIDKTSANYSRVLSILNSNSRVNAQLQKVDYFGTLEWDGLSPDIVQLKDIPKQAPVKVGDTIVTGGRSTIFPKGILIGTVTDFEIDETENYFTLNVRLFNDMASIGHVHVIEIKQREEINSLDASND